MKPLCGWKNEGFAKKLVVHLLKSVYSATKSLQKYQFIFFTFVLLHAVYIPVVKMILLAEGEVGRSLATDGVFLYTTSSNGKGIAKFGTGLHGSLR